MPVYIHENHPTFHLRNDEISYVMRVLPDGQLGQLYFGSRIHDRDNYDYLLEGTLRSHSAYPADDQQMLSRELIRQEYPSFGTGDYRQGAVEVLQKNGSRAADFRYQGYDLLPGKPVLEGLPATYTESDDEAETLVIHLKDELTGLSLDLLYTIFAGKGILARSACMTNNGTDSVMLERAMSFCLDLPDCRYDWIQFSGSWARERFPVKRKLDIGTTEIESLRGHSSHQQNPFVILKRPEADEFSGEVIGLSFVYSGNFKISAQVDPYGVTRLMAGINPTWFSWKLEPGQSFQTPEAVMVYSRNGMNGMSQDLHSLYRKRLVRGVWRDQVCPILINNWEATYFDFNEEKLLHIAEKSKECGVELFVLDDGWFGARRNDRAGLGDWVPCTDLLPEGIVGLAEKVTALGLKFGLWIEPEMVNPDSDLFRAHPDWCLHIPGRSSSLCRGQLVLDFSRPEVVDYICEMISKILREAKISYIKWDMNRSITECYSSAAEPDRQGEIYHRQILGVYSMYERLIREFPHVLFESCAGGGGRFDAGMLYYAPQAWTSDDTDAMERLRIQYGTSYGYPISSMGSHVSAVPNHQLNRITPLKTRADVAYFGSYGYELDLNRLSAEEQAEVSRYSQFMKDHRELLQYGTFYRLQSPFESNEAAWMVASEDRSEAIVGFYRTLSTVNQHLSRVYLRGLDPDACYHIEDLGDYYGDELMNAGLVVSDGTSGKVGENIIPASDFFSRLFIIHRASSCRTESRD